MREILFRGKHINSGNWIYGHFVHQYGADMIYLPEGVDSEFGFDYHYITEGTLGQYTGLTDKNGKKIFEGDICRNTKTGEIVSVVWHGTMAGYVWSRRKEGCKHLFDFGELFRCFDKYEVIGNIYDNPELMKGGAE